MELSSKTNWSFLKERPGIVFKNEITTVTYFGKQSTWVGSLVTLFLSWDMTGRHLSKGLYTECRSMQSNLDLCNVRFDKVLGLEPN